MQTQHDLEPMLQAFHDLYLELEPDSELSTFDNVRQGIRYCVANDIDPEQAIIDIQTCSEPFINVQ